MNKSPVILITMTIAVALLILPTVEAADIELSDACSLADAIKAANTDEIAGGCPAGDGADTIVLSDDIMLDAALPHITTEITIGGGGFTISGKNRFRIFTVNRGRLTVKSLTMTRGNADWGGAIVNVDGTLTTSESSFINNRSSEGGAIGSTGRVSITQSSFNNNVADLGGALHQLEEKLVISDSTFANNKSNEEGGAIYNEGTLVEIFNSTFSNNASGGAIWHEEGRLEIVSSVFYNNEMKRWWVGGAAIHSLSRDKVSVRNSTFKYNRAVLPQSSQGGAILSRNAPLDISDCSFIRNSAEEGVPFLMTMF